MNTEKIYQYIKKNLKEWLYCLLWGLSFTVVFLFKNETIFFMDEKYKQQKINQFSTNINTQQFYQFIDLISVLLIIAFILYVVLIVSGKIPFVRLLDILLFMFWFIEKSIVVLTGNNLILIIILSVLLFSRLTYLFRRRWILKIK